MKSRFRCVDVTWEDACTHDPWRDVDDLDERETALCRTRGFLIRETATELLVAVTVSEDEQFFGTVAIPKRFVRKVKGIEAKSLRSGEAPRRKRDNRRRK